MSTDSVHIAVLLHEVIEGLKLGADKLGVSEKAQGAAPRELVYLDGTLGGAGHALAVTKACSGKLTLIGLDRDPEAIRRAGINLEGKATKVILENESFSNLDKVLDKHSIKQVDRILLDLGISSDELESSGRGFTFSKDEPLSMTMGNPKTYPFTAQTIVNNWKEEDIANVIFGYGEDRYARRIAKAVVTYREKKLIETTTELAEIVKSAVPFFARGTFRGKTSGKKAIHPATKTFQALRIAVNDELNALKEGLDKGYAHLSDGGIMAVVSFHSLEDRIVKTFFRAQVGASISKKPITPSPQELAENPRSRSAKLRFIEKSPR